MKSYTPQIKSLPLDDTWDVIIAGGGPAGCTAAAAAAREGARTLLIEATGALGGMGTCGLVPCWCPFSDREKIIYRGLAEKVFIACKAGIRHVAPDALDWVPIDPEHLKRVYDDLVTASGATILFHTVLASVEKDTDDQVSAILLANKSGLSACKAKVYVDCTGDADLAAWAGAAFEQGDAKGEVQPATLCFVLTNVDEYAYRHGSNMCQWPPDENGVVYRILRSGKYPLIADIHFCNNLIGPGTVGFNAGHLWDVDNTAPGKVSRAMIEGRKIAGAFRDALAEFHPRAFANAYLVSTATLMGSRESRRIIGDYCLTVDDYRARRGFPDEICRNSYAIDIHPSKEENTDPIKGFQTMVDRTEYYGKGESHGIPYRCLTPRGLKNVLVAGRSISCDRIMQGSIRVMPVCLAMGEAAGMAAAHAMVMDTVDVHSIDVNRLRKRLKEENAYLP